MRILNVSFGQDTGGQAWRLSQAWQRHRPEDEYLSVVRTPTFYPIQQRMDRSRMKRWMDRADVIHANNDLRTWENTRYYHPRRSFLDTPKIVHYHGSMFRGAVDVHLGTVDQYRALPLVSTLDLAAFDPDRLIWLPSPYSLEELQRYRDPQPDNGTLRIAHAPTDRKIKSTEAVINAVLRLQRIGVKVELDLIERVKNEECMRRKGRADVFVDQLILGYGNNAVEAWGMGIPVIANVQPQQAMALIRQPVPESTPALMRKIWDRYPFYRATEENLYQALLKMRDPEVRAQWAEKGMDHFLRFHSEEKVVEQLRSLYVQQIEGQEVATDQETDTAQGSAPVPAPATGLLAAGE